MIFVAFSAQIKQFVLICEIYDLKEINMTEILTKFLFLNSHKKVIVLMCIIHLPRMHFLQERSFSPISLAAPL